jgi:WD40 repeat protein
VAEARPSPLELVATALRNVMHRADESPADIAPLLYSSLRLHQRDDGEIERLLDLAPNDVTLRIASYHPEPDARVRLRPPAPVVAIHTFATERLITVVRCTTALLFLRGDGLVATAMAAGLTASALTRDSELLMTGHADGTITFWNAETGQFSERFAAHRAAVTHVLATFDSAYSCAADGSIVRWQRSGDGWRQTRLQGQPGITSAIASGDHLVIGCANGDILELVGTSTTLHARAHDGPVTGLALRQNDEVLVSAGADRMLRTCVPRLPDTALKIPSEHTHGISGLAASPGSEAFATYSADCTVRLWSVLGISTAQWIQPVNVFTEHEAAVTSVSFSRIGNQDVLVSGSADGAIVVRLGGSSIAKLHAHDGPVRAFGFLPDRLLTGGDDAQLGWWRVTGSSIDSLPPDGVTSIATARGRVVWCRSGNLALLPVIRLTMEGLAVAVALQQYGQGAVIWTPGSSMIREVDLASSSAGELLSFESGIVAAFFVLDRLFAALENGTVVDVRTQQRFRREEEPRITCAAGQPNGFFVLTGRVNGDVVMMTLQAEPSLGIRHIGAHPAPVTALAFSPSVAPIASGAADGSVVVWAIGDQPGAVFRGNHNGPVRHLAFLSDIALASAGDDRLVILWNYRTSERIATCAGHRDRITALLFDDRSQLLYTASLDATIRVWDLQGKQRGIVYGTHPFSTLALLYDDVLPGQIIAGDDAGAIWTLAFRGKDEPTT